MPQGQRHSEHLADLSRLTFSTRGWREIARKGTSSSIEHALTLASCIIETGTISRAECLRAIHAWMLSNHRSDYIYRQSVIAHFANRSKSHSVRVSTEVYLRSSIADLMHIGKDLELFEIKSDRDNTARLSNQLHNAYLVSPYASLLTTPTNAYDFLARTPSTPVGVYTIGPRGGIRALRRPRARWKRLEAIEILNLLRANERAYALRDLLPNLLNEPNAIQYRIAAERVAELYPKDFYLRAMQSIRLRPRIPLDPKDYYLYPILVALGPNQRQMSRMQDWLKEKVR